MVFKVKVYIILCILLVCIICSILILFNVCRFKLISPGNNMFIIRLINIQLISIHDFNVYYILFIVDNFIVINVEDVYLIAVCWFTIRMFFYFTLCMDCVGKLVHFLSHSHPDWCLGYLIDLCCMISISYSDFFLLINVFMILTCY